MPAGTTIYTGSFNGVAVECNHWQSLCPTGTIRQRSVGRGFEEGQVLWASVL
jgi:hypothetical protein